MSQIVVFSFHDETAPQQNVANGRKVADFLRNVANGRKVANFLRNMKEFLKKMSQMTSLPAAKLREIPIIFQVLI